MDGAVQGAGGFALRPVKLHPDQLPNLSISGDTLEVGEHAKREKTNKFPLIGYTSASARDAPPHPSGWKVSVELERQGRAGTGEDSRWRSADRLGGTVTLSPPSQGGSSPPTSLIVRVFCQSTTIYWVSVVRDTTAKIGAGMNQLKADSQPRVEWARSYVGGREGTPLISAGQGSPLKEPQVYPFEFSLPKEVQVDEASVPEEAPPFRDALHSFARTPPASLPPVEGRSAAVEWTVEVIANFGTPSTSAPSLGDSVPPVNGDTSPFGLVRPTEQVLVHRMVFPFEPSDAHTQDLYSSWRPTIHNRQGLVSERYRGIPEGELDLEPSSNEALVPSFGKDPRDEVLGGAAISSRRSLHGDLIQKEGGRERWSTFEKRSTTTGFLRKATGTIVLEGSVPRPARIARHAASLPVLLSIAYDAPQGKDGKKGKSVEFESATVVLSQRTNTRGGSEDTPHFILEELRRQTLPLSASLALGEVHGFKFEFDLQSEGSYTHEGKDLSQQPLKNLGLSLRAVNVEREYYVALQVKQKGEEPVHLIRAPVQVIAGDLEDAPAFEAADGGARSSGVGKAELPSY